MNEDVLLFTEDFKEAKAEIEAQGGRITHKFSPEAFVARLPNSLSVGQLQKSQSTPPRELTSALKTAVKAWEARLSIQDRAPLATEGLSWGSPGYQAPGYDDTAEVVLPGISLAGEDDRESTGTSTSLYMIGSVAVGIVVVSGSTASLQISAAENTQILAEVIEGLNFLANAEPRANVSFDYDIHFVKVSATPGSPGNYEAPWQDAALTALGYSTGRTGSRQYVQDIRSSKGTDWAYVAYFTKYPVKHFAYAGGERVVMHYDNDGWGPDDINRVFAHETCHIFGAADEYGSCGCGASGFLQVPNNNCRNCTSSQVACLMDANTLSLCQWSRGQIGWDDRLLSLSVKYIANKCLGKSPPLSVKNDIFPSGSPANRSLRNRLDEVLRSCLGRL